MKCLRRCLCALLCCVLLSGVFSTTASAKEVTNFKFTIGYNDSFATDTLTAVSGDSKSKSWTSNFKPSVTSSVNPYVYIESADGSTLAKKNKNVDFTLNNIQFEIYASDSSSELYDWYMGKYNSIEFICHYTDGTLEWFTGLTMSQDEKKIQTFNINFTPSKDVKKIQIAFKYVFYDRVGAGVLNQTIKAVYANVYNVGASVEVQSEESGLLSGLIGWVKNIFDSVKDGFSALGDGLTNVWNSIKELPQKIWTFIENGLKSLFVPDEDYIFQFKDDINDMLSTKFGAVYQVIDITLESWDRIQVNDETDSIEIPSTTINVSSGEKFSFGGYDVKVVPDGFGFIVDILKLIVGISCTVLFINGMRHRYDEVMGVEK